MSTYTNSESVINVASISGASGTVYTCPAGRYAKVKIHGFTCLSSTTSKITLTVAGQICFRTQSGGASGLEVFGGGDGSGSGSETYYPYSWNQEFYLNAGQTIVFTPAGTGSIKGTAIEFVKP